VPEPQQLPFIYEPWPGALKAWFNFNPTEDDLRRHRNEAFRQELNSGAYERMILGVLEQAQNPASPDLPRVTPAEWAEYTQVVDRCKNPFDPLRAGLVSDHPITAAKLAELTGGKSRNKYNSLIKKGLLHSYGKGKGAVPAWVRRDPPDASRFEWFELTPLQRRILMLFSGKTWCCRPVEFEKEFLRCRSWKEAKLRDGAVGLLGTEIATKLGMEYEHDNHLRDELAKLVKKARGKEAILVKGRTSKRSKTHVGYLPNPRGWPFDARALPFCPVIDLVNRARRWRGQADLPIT